MEDQEEEEEGLVPMKASSSAFNHEEVEELVPMEAGSPKKVSQKEMSPNLVKIEPNTIQ